MLLGARTREQAVSTRQGCTPRVLAALVSTLNGPITKAFESLLPVTTLALCSMLCRARSSCDAVPRVPLVPASVCCVACALLHLWHPGANSAVSALAWPRDHVHAACSVSGVAEEGNDLQRLMLQTPVPAAAMSLAKCALGL